MDHPVALLIVISVIALALALGVFSDLRHAWASVRAGAAPLDPSTLADAKPRGGYETIRTNVDPGRHWRTGRPLHRNFGLSEGGEVYSRHKALTRPGDDLMSPGEAKRI